jgi:CheY-like chemotaxis protein
VRLCLGAFGDQDGVNKAFSLGDTRRKSLRVEIENKATTLFLYLLVCINPNGSFLVLGDVVTRILIADDRESMRMALKTLFVLRPSWEICGEAEDGREAVSKATDLRPDLIVLDFKMPLTDGLQAAQEIGRNLPTTPIVMYTLYKDEQLESIAKSAGVRRVVAKEDGVQGLLGAIEAELVTKESEKNSDQA